MTSFKDLLQSKKALILHGALGTELEYKGYDISGKLWSAKYLLEKPEAIEGIHEEYVKAGSDIITTSSYQASVKGLVDYGLSVEKAKELIKLSVDLAKDARDKVWAELSEEEKTSRVYPLISGDVGPYAGYLADGSEYNGKYGEVTKEDLKDFHRERIAILLENGSDLLALETMPNKLEIEALTELLADEFPKAEAYLSVTTQDGNSLSDGTSIKKFVEIVNSSEQILALGVNCSSVANSDKFLKELAALTEKVLVAYPNSGEIYDGATQTWKEDVHACSIADYSQEWVDLGVKVLGGCCRTRPSHILDIVEKLKYNKTVRI